MKRKTTIAALALSLLPAAVQAQPYPLGALNQGSARGCVPSHC